MKAVGKGMSLKAMVLNNGVMETFIKVSLKMGLKMETDLINGLMDQFMREIGKMGK